MKYKFLCLSLLLLASSSVFCIEKKDSLFLNLLQTSQTKLADNYFYEQYLIKGFDFILQDSIEEGFSNLSIGIKLSDKNSHLNKFRDYRTKEFCNFIHIVADSLTSQARKQIIIDFFRNWFSNDPVAQKKIMDMKWKKSDEPEILLRLQIFWSHLNQDIKIRDKYLQTLLALSPNLLPANILKAEIHYSKDEWLESKIYFSRTLELRPIYSYAYAYRGLCNKKMDLTEKARNDLKQAVKLSPGYVYAWNELGRIQLNANSHKKAAHSFRKAIEINPYYTWAHNNLGLTYSKMQMADSALFYYNNAIDLDPNNAKYYNNKGDVYYESDNYEKAVYYYSKAIEFAPDNDYYWKDRGNAYYYMDSLDLAIIDFSKAYELDDQYDYVIKKIGDCYYGHQSWEEAVKYYNKAIKIDPKYQYAISRRGYCYLKLEEYEKALVDFNKSIDIDPNQVYNWLDRASYWSKMKKYNAARDDLIKAIEVDPENSTAYGNLGWAYYCLGEFEKCIEFSKKAITMDKDAFYAKFNYALATLRLGMIEEAKNLYRIYYREAFEKEADIEGSIKDLEDLLGKKIQVEESTFILEKIFHKKSN